MLDRSTCGFATYNECDPATCERQCSATIWIAPSETTLGRQMLRTSRSTLWLVLAAAVTVFIFAASVGLARAERAYQLEQV